jgi:uncharacterized membrane protein YgcG
MLKQSPPPPKRMRSRSISSDGMTARFNGGAFRQSLTAFASVAFRSQRTDEPEAKQKAGSLWPAPWQLSSHSLPIALAVILAWSAFALWLFLLPVAFRLLLALIFINLIQDQFAHRALVRHVVIEFVLVGIALDPFINLFIDAGILAELPGRFWRCGRGGGWGRSRRGDGCGCLWYRFCFCAGSCHTFSIFWCHQSFVPFTEGATGGVNSVSACCLRN